MTYEFKTRRRIEFADTDMAGIVHFANFFRYMETAEHDFFRSLGLTLHRQGEDRSSGFVRVHAECDYRSPLRYQDEVEIHLLVEKRSTRSLTYRFRFRKTEEQGTPCPPVDVATGSLVVVHVTRDGAGREWKSTELASELAQRLEEAPERLLTEKT